MKSKDFDLDSIVLICTNEREAERKSCGASNSKKFRELVKKSVSECESLKLKKIRVSASGCLGRCEEGVAVLMMPQEEWLLDIKLEGRMDEATKELVDVLEERLG